MINESCNDWCNISGQGSHVLQTDQVEEISEIISHASVGKSAPLIKRQTGKRSKSHLYNFYENPYPARTESD